MAQTLNPQRALKLKPPQCSRPLGAHDVLTVDQAVRELGIRRVDGARWLADRGLVVEIAGRRRVIWGEVIEALRGRAASEVRQEVERRNRAGSRLRVPIPKTTSF